MMILTTNLLKMEKLSNYFNNFRKWNVNSWCLFAKKNVMYKKILNSLQFLFIIILFIYVFIVYFSKDVSDKINQNRVSYYENIKNKTLNIPLLKNDTHDVINFNLETNVEKKIKKRYFWNLLKDD